MAKTLKDIEAALPGMIGQDPLMATLYRNVRAVAPSGLSILIVGETGTGKELIARAIHELSGHTDFDRFVDVNCAAMPEQLCEGELFGWERGAFTGAVHQRDGLLELANGGTLFLDELCSMSVHIQAKLLRALEQKEFRRVGGRRRLASDFRVVATVSEPMEQLIKDGRLRPDLAYRVAGSIVSAPPLRCRRTDIRRLIDRFLAQDSEDLRIAEDAFEVLVRYEWPGNVRELKNLIDRLKVGARGGCLTRTDVIAAYPPLVSDMIQEEELREVLEDHDWRITQTARALGIPRSTLRSRITALGLERPAVV